MIELANQIFTEGGIVALVLIIVLIILAAIVYVLLLSARRKDTDADAILALANTVSQFVTPLKEVANANAETSANLLKVLEMFTAHDLRVAGMGTIIDDAISAMRETVATRDDQIDQLPGTVREAMKDDFDQLPKVIENALLPTIQSLKNDIALLINGLDEKLTTRIKASTGAIPSETAKMITSEISKLEHVIDAKLAEFLEIAKSTMANNATTPQGDDKPKTDKPNRPREA